MQCHLPCRAFSVIEAVESKAAIMNHPLAPLSTQQLLSCDTASQYGCSGGLPSNAFAWLKEVRGRGTGRVWWCCSQPYTSCSTQYRWQQSRSTPLRVLMATLTLAENRGECHVMSCDMADPSVWPVSPGLPMALWWSPTPL